MLYSFAFGWPSTHSSPLKKTRKIMWSNWSSFSLTATKPTNHSLRTEINKVCRQWHFDYILCCRFSQRKTKSVLHLREQGISTADVWWKDKGMYHPKMNRTAHEKETVCVRIKLSWTCFSLFFCLFYARKAYRRSKWVSQQEPTSRQIPIIHFVPPIWNWME